MIKQWYHIIIVWALLVGILCTSGYLNLFLFIVQWLFVIDYGIAVFKNGDELDSYLHRWLTKKKKPKNRRKGI